MSRTYYAEIMSEWDWTSLTYEAKNEAIGHIASGGTSVCSANMGEQCDDNGHVGSAYLGTVMALAPSGKFYAPWTTNQTADDVRRDSAWYAALDKAAAKHGGYILNGEDDPTDLYFMCYFTHKELS